MGEKALNLVRNPKTTLAGYPQANFPASHP